MGVLTALGEILSPQYLLMMIAGTIGAALYLLCGTYVANVYTDAAAALAPDMIPEGTMLVSSISAGNPIYTVLLFLCKILGLGA